ncbi:MAG: hemolysin family protein [Candidatus Gracilibacteria bacterium]
MDPILVLIFIILFLLSAFFSGTELALMSLPQHKIDSLLKGNKFGTKSLKKIKSNNDRLLITILIGNNLVNVYTAALATTIAISFGESLELSQSTVIGIATGIVTFLLLLFGEIIPKSYATKNAATISLLVAPIYKILMIVLHPIIIFIEIIIKVFSGKAKVEQVTEEEIESFIDMGRKMGGLDDSEHKKIKSILEFDETIVEEIMTPRVKIEAINIDSTVKEAMDFYLSHTHSRIPVYTKTIDKINHFITARDLMPAFSSCKFDMKISELELREVMKVPLNQPIERLLETFQKFHKIMAIVIDEYGGVSGLITMEDIIEEVFGEIRDETDKESEEIIEITKDNLVVKSYVLIEEILRKFKFKLSDIGLDEREFGGETLSYVITHILGGFPKNDQIITFDIKNKNYTLSCKILEIENAKIGKVDIRKLKKI